MAFCTKCGKQLADDANFCFNCGWQISGTEIAEQGQRIQVFEGKIRKCPNCGQVLESFTAFCPTCGCELRGVKVSTSIHEFAQKLTEAKTDDQQVTLIRSFPIPNTKEDIFEFFILSSTNIVNATQKHTFDAWIAKFEQCYQKANLVFKGDRDFQKIKAIYEETSQRIKNKKATLAAKDIKDTTTSVFSAMPNPVFGIVAVIVCLFDVISLVQGYFSGMHVIFSLLILKAAYNITEKAKKKDDMDIKNRIKVPSAIAGYKSKDYSTIEAILASVGFVNIKCVPLNDLSTGFLKKPRMVDSITIDGNSIISLNKKYDFDVPIVIAYHSFSEQ